jgi:hypothetical protein
MHAAWCRAGWPTFSGGQWPTGTGWTVIDLAEFAHVGGLAVRDDKLIGFMAWLWPIDADQGVA